MRWPEGSAVPPAEAIEVRVYPSDVWWFGFVIDQARAAPAVSADGRTMTDLNEPQDPQGKKTPLFGPPNMVAVFFDPTKAPAPSRPAAEPLSGRSSRVARAVGAKRPACSDLHPAPCHASVADGKGPPAEAIRGYKGGCGVRTPYLNMEAR